MSQLSSNAQMSYKFKTLNDNADPTFNQLLGINNNGVISGYFGSGAPGHPNKGYTLNPPYGQHNYKNENFPGSVQTQVVAINNHGDTAGFWINNGDIVGFFTATNGSVVSFLRYAKNKSYAEFEFPHSTNTTALGINNHDQIVGVYVDGANKMHGFLFSPLNHGKWQSIDDPNGIGTTTINGLNDKGQLVGFYVDSAGNTNGFLAK